MTTSPRRGRGAGILRIALAAATTAALLAFAGCSGTGPQESTGGPAPAASEAYLKYRMPQEPPLLDPHRTNEESSLLYLVNMFDGLVKLEPGGTKVVPALAESWTISPDSTTYTFKLRKGITFHNGRAIVADDVIYSLERALDPKNPSPLRPLLSFIEGADAFVAGQSGDIEGLTAPDPETVVIRLTHPFGAFLAALTAPVGSVVPREVYDDPAEGYLRHPVGSGPFRFESWENNIAIKLAAFDDYWAGKPGLPGIEVRFIPDITTAFEEYKTGGLDYLNEVPPGQRAWVREHMGGEYHAWPRLAIAAVGFDFTKAPFKGNPTLRRALNFAVDRDRIANVLQEGKDEAASRLIPPGILGHTDGPGPYRYDPAEAKRLLAEAGYPEGKGLPELTYLTPTNESIRRYAEAVQANFAAIGVKVRLDSMDFKAYYETLSAVGKSGTNLNLYQLTFYADFPDPDGLLWPLLHSSSFGLTGNMGHYSNPEVDRLLEAGRLEANDDKRAEIYREAEAKALEDGCMIPIYFYGDDALVKPYIQGFLPSPMGDFTVPMERLRDTRR